MAQKNLQTVSDEELTNISSVATAESQQKQQSNKTQLQRYDAWVWNSGSLQRSSKVQNSIKRSTCCASCGIDCLMVFRGVVSLIMVIHWLHSGVEQFKQFGFFALQYFTIWGMWLTTTYFIYAFVSLLRYRKKEDQLKDSDSIWHTWKWLSSLFMTAVMWQSVISIVYWSVLYEDDKERVGNTFMGNYWNFCDHLFPIIFLIIDWFLNRIYFEKNQIYANMLIFFLYGMINLTVTYARGKPVYPPMSWDSFGSVCFALVMFPLAIGFYFAFYFLTKFKFRKMEMHDSIKYNVEESETDASSIREIS